MTSKPDVQFTVLGKPAPGGSKRHVGRGRIIDSCATNKPWRYAVSACAMEAMNGRPPHDGACRVEMTFNGVRPKGHYGSGRNADKLKASAPVNWITRPDALKLGRAVEDAMTGIVYIDDSMIVDERLVKRYAVHASCEIRVWFVEDVPTVND